MSQGRWRGINTPSLSSARWEEKSHTSGSTAGIAGTTAAVFTRASKRSTGPLLSTTNPTSPVPGGTARGTAEGTGTVGRTARTAVPGAVPAAVPFSSAPLEMAVPLGTAGSTVGGTGTAGRTPRTAVPAAVLPFAARPRELAVVPPIPAVLPLPGSFHSFGSFSSHRDNGDKYKTCLNSYKLVRCNLCIIINIKT